MSRLRGQRGEKRICQVFRFQWLSVIFYRVVESSGGDGKMFSPSLMQQIERKEEGVSSRHVHAVLSGAIFEGVSSSVGVVGVPCYLVIQGNHTQATRTLSDVRQRGFWYY